MQAYLYMLLATVAYSFFPMLNAMGLQFSSPLVFILLTFVLSTILVWTIVVYITRARVRELATDLRNLDWEQFSTVALSGIITSLGYIFFLWGFSLMSKAGSAIIIESWPILAMFLSPLILQKKWEGFSWLDGLYLTMAGIGIGLITYGNESYSLDEIMNTPFAVFGSDMYTYLGVLLSFAGAFCFALSGVFRAQFANLLPDNFGENYLKRNNGINRMIISEALSKSFCTITALIALLFMEFSFEFEAPEVLVPSVICSFIIIFTGVFYSQALVLAHSPRINLVWYMAPLLAVIWLITTGYSEINLLILIGGALVLFTNFMIGLQTAYSDRAERRKLNAENIPDDAAKPM